ncbi:MAG: hypothetical protein ABIM31_00410 [candidate division WOR-3 bacterium]
MTIFMVIFLTLGHSKDFVIQILKKGGVLGFSEEIILINQTITYIDKRKDLRISAKIGKNNLKLIRKIAKKLLQKDEAYGKTYPDCIIYEIRVNEVKKITYIPGPEMREKDLDELIELFYKFVQSDEKEKRR